MNYQMLKHRLKFVETALKKNEKKPYRIKFDKKQVMLGLNNDLSAKSWVLLAEYVDKTLLINTTAFFMGNEILGGDGYYVIKN